MNVYTKEPRFDVRTGARNGEQLVLSHYLCDYCGKIIDRDDPSISDAPSFQIHDSGDIEESWYYLELPRELRTRLQEQHQDFEPHRIFTEHPHYRYCNEFETNTSCSGAMITEAVQTPRQDGLYLFTAMQEARMRMVQKALEQGISPLFLDLIED